MNKALRSQLYWRSKGYCEKCGTWIQQDNFAAHHRKLRSAGGKDHIQNLVALCHDCHNLGSDSIHLNPEIHYKLGWIVHGWQDPASVAICADDGRVILLNEDGTKLELEEKT